MDTRRNVCHAGLFRRTPQGSRSSSLVSIYTVRAGLHWGATLYIGSIVTAGRTEVTALGDEVNDAARIEACAAGGRIFVSKDLIERLDPDHAATLGIDPNHLSYTQLADLDTASDKARRDAPTIPVHDISITRA